MRAVYALLVTITVVAAACSSTDVEATFEATPSSSESVEPVALPSGRGAIAKAQAEGAAYVLWFWGAH